MQIGSAFCGKVVHTPGQTDTRLTCQLPAGTNTKQLVVVNQGQLFSIGVPLVSYAAPRVFRISGCQDVGERTLRSAEL